MNIRLVLVICLALCVGCAQTDLSREFSYTHKDKSRYVIQITYKPKSHFREGSKIGAYYYTLQYFESPVAKPKVHPFLHLYFYDSKGYTLLDISPSDAYTFGYQLHKVFERNRTDKGWEYKGRFDEERIAIENFTDIHSFVVKKR